MSSIKKKYSDLHVGIFCLLKRSKVSERFVYTRNESRLIVNLLIGWANVIEFG